MGPWRSISSVACGALLLAAIGCGGASQTEEIEFRVPVDASAVGAGTVEDRILATGTLRAASSARLLVENTGILAVARARGQRLAEGDAVHKGQLIAEVAGEDVVLVARTEATQRRLETAQRDHDSKQRLYADGLITLLELKQAESSLAEAKSEYDRSRFTETRRRLVTPIAGTIVKLARDPQGLPLTDGQRVMVGTEIAQVAALATLIADIDLVGPDVARVEAGMEARVRHHAFAQEQFTAKVLRLSPSLDPQTRALRAEIEVANTDQRLRPGMFVEVMLIAARHENVPIVPRTAVTERGGKKVVFVVKEQQVEQRTVTLGLGDDETVEIREGLKLSERVVTRGLETLTDGTKVRVTG